MSVGVTPDGRWVVSGSKDRSIQFWNADQEQAHLMLQGHKNSGQLVIASTQSGDRSLMLSMYPSVISIDLSKQGDLLASGSGDCQARIWRYDYV